jgi:catechol 2,3-dioxygenase-like lactoylglutathione lyase family enzyme
VRVAEVCVTEIVLDHVSVGTRALADGWELFGGLLGGTWVYGGDSPGFWWGQLQFRSGPKIELITPTPGPDSAFLERFLAVHGPGQHHLNFIVSDIAQTLRRIAALGIEPVQVRLDQPNWKEAFLRPADAYGTVVQVAEQSGQPPVLAPPPDLPPPGPSCAFALVEHYVDDLAGAMALFGDVLAGELISQQDGGSSPEAELCWQNGARLRLMQVPRPAAGTASSRSGAPGTLHFVPDGELFGPAEVSRVAELSRLLGVSVQLGS